MKSISMLGAAMALVVGNEAMSRRSWPRRGDGAIRAEDLLRAKLAANLVTYADVHAGPPSRQVLRRRIRQIQKRQYRRKMLLWRSFKPDYRLAAV